jgi:hypothetical protein
VIVNVRGTHGSGKSHLVYSILRRYGSEELPAEDHPKKPDGHLVRVPWLGRGLVVIGHYHTACGGCDGVQPFSLIFPRVERYAKSHHVLFEGALVSTSGYGRVTRMVELFGDRFVVAFLDTPLGVCLERIAARRRVRGDDRPVNPANTESKYLSLRRSVDRVRALGARVVLLDHRNAEAQLLGVFHGAD